MLRRRKIFFMVKSFLVEIFIKKLFAS